MSGERDGQGWLFQVAPEIGESFDHYLGRFRRANCLSRSGLAELMARCFADTARVETLTVAELRVMLPMARSELHLETRLCPFCYGETPIHQNQWQQAKVGQCARHDYPLLSRCPACGSGFRLPALWESGSCERCWLPFRDMRLHRGEPTG